MLACNTGLTELSRKATMLRRASSLKAHFLNRQPMLQGEAAKAERQKGCNQRLILEIHFTSSRSSLASILLRSAQFHLRTKALDKAREVSAKTMCTRSPSGTSRADS